MAAAFDSLMPRTLVVIALVAGIGCQLKRPDTLPSRMIEPQMEASAPPRVAGLNVTLVRLLDTQARAHIGRRMLRQEADGELVEDPVWRWSSAPDRYLDTALRLELTSRPDVRLVDAADAPALAVTLLVWHLESSAVTQLVGVIQIQLTAVDRTVREELIRDSEPVSGELPGNLSTAAGRLLHRLASEGITRMVTPRAARAHQ
jgi:hypothetical protein